MDIEAVFESFDEDYRKFDAVKTKLSSRPDLHAMLLLERLVPEPGEDIICCAEHDEFWLATEVEKLADVATEDDIRDLVRCGVRLDGDSLCMFV